MSGVRKALVGQTKIKLDDLPLQGALFIPYIIHRQALLEILIYLLCTETSCFCGDFHLGYTLLLSTHSLNPC